MNDAESWNQNVVQEIEPLGILSLTEKILSYDGLGVLLSHQSQKNDSELWRISDSLKFERGEIKLRVDRDSNDYPFVNLEIIESDEKEYYEFNSNSAHYPHTTLMVNRVKIQTNNPEPKHLHQILNF